MKVCYEIVDHLINVDPNNYWECDLAPPTACAEAIAVGASYAKAMRNRSSIARLLLVTQLSTSIKELIVKNKLPDLSPL